MGNLDILKTVVDFIVANKNEIGYIEINFEKDTYTKLSITIDLVNCINISIVKDMISYNTMTSDEMTETTINSKEQLIEILENLIKGGN